MNNKLSIVLITIISMMVMASCGNAEVLNETSVESSTQDQIEEEEITVTDTDSTTASSTVEIVAEQDAEETLAAEEPTEQIEKTVDLKAIWGDTDVEEYVDPVLNVHFYLPKTVEVSNIDDNGHLIIHLYEQMPDHTATWDWYDIDPKTLTGTDILGEKVDLN